MKSMRIKTIMAVLGITSVGLALWLGSAILAHTFTTTESFEPVNANATGVVTVTCDYSEDLSISIAGTAMTEQSGDGNTKDSWILATTVSHSPAPAHRWEIFFVRDVNGFIGTVNYNTNNGFYTVLGHVELRRGWFENPDQADVSRVSKESLTVQPEENGDYQLVAAIWDDATKTGIEHCTYTVYIEAHGNLSCDRNEMGVYIDLESPGIFGGDGTIDYYDDNYPGAPIKTWTISP